MDIVGARLACDGFDISGWLRAGVTREQVVAGLRPLLDLPVEHVLPAHGAPTDRAALERALSSGAPAGISAASSGGIQGRRGSGVPHHLDAPLDAWKR